MKQKLFNPFIKVAGLKAFAIGLVFLFISIFLAWKFNTNFDGVLDVHYGGQATFQHHFSLSLLNVFSAIVVFYLIAVILTRGKTRFADIAGTVTLARFPFVIAPLLNIGNISSLIGEKIVYGLRDQIGGDLNNFTCDPCTISTLEYVYLILSMIVVLLIIAWHVTLLFNAYKVSTNLKGANVIVSFIAGVILSEVVSSILIRFIL